jgi:hypothetical protein
MFEGDVAEAYQSGLEDSPACLIRTVARQSRVFRMPSLNDQRCQSAGLTIVAHTQRYY